MTTDQLKNVILEAVDCLRQRKCRPDRESIAVYVMRKLGSSMNEIFSEIENTVDQGLLLKVEYKGSTSYRSPKNFDLKNSPLLTKHSKILNSSKTTRYVISGINELLSNNSAYSQMGVPFEELKKKLQEFDKERFTEEAIKVIFEREEGSGNIQVAQLDDPLDPIRIFPKDIKVPEDMKPITFSDDATSTPDRKKRKRPKKSDDSDAASKGAVNAKKDNKQVLVYAIKSDPHKLAEASLRDEESVKAKVEQISSIGLKVISEKGTSRKPSVKAKAKNGVSAQDKSTASTSSEIEISNDCERKPSLALVKVEPTKQPEVNGSVLSEDSEVDVQPDLSTAPKIGKRKGNVVQKMPKSVKQKKLKLDTPTDDSEETVTLSRNPPRYTYASKKRAKDEYYEDSEDKIEQVIKKPMKKGASESVTLVQHSNGHLGECAYCKQEKNAAGEAEDFLQCGTCNAKIHPTCIAYSEDHAKRLRINSGSKDDKLQWQCFSCKRCGVCKKALMASKSGSTLKKTKAKNSKKNEQRYILCDDCDRGYHVKCVNGSLPLNESSWYCGECSNSEIESQSTTIEKTGRSKKSRTMAKKPAKVISGKKKGDQSKEPSDSSKDVSHTENPTDAESSAETPIVSNSSDSRPDEEIPDISTWTPAQVQKYFTEKGLQDEAASLREQEIDGMSLLLLRRADVIFGLNLRLGPALKIYRLVCQLQQHSSALKKTGKSGKSP